MMSGGRSWRLPSRWTAASGRAAGSGGAADNGVATARRSAETRERLMLAALGGPASLLQIDGRKRHGKSGCDDYSTDEEVGRRRDTISGRALGLRGRARPSDRFPMSTADPLAPDPAGHCLFRCPGCGLDIECLAADAERYVLVGCPLCGGAIEPVGPPPESASSPQVPAATDAGRNKRLTPRRLVRGGARAEVRRGMLGLGKDLA